jgi:hypothetical protein
VKGSLDAEMFKKFIMILPGEVAGMGEEKFI